MAKKNAGEKTPSKRSKRSAIMDLAAREFANTGYRAAKWGDVAEELGIGSTALYHYFESKEHCLFEIMGETLSDSLEFFAEAREKFDDPREVIGATIGHNFDGGEAGIARNRLQMAEMNLIALPRKGKGREQEAFDAARRYAHDIVHDWTTYLERCTRDGSIPEQDPHLLARALIGVSSYVFSWYMPGSKVPLEELRETTVAHALAIVFGTEAANGKKAGRVTAAAKR